MFDINKMPHIIFAQLAQHKSKGGYSNATLVADINSFATRNWDEGYLDDLFAGRIVASTDAVDVFTKYLLVKFYHYNSS